jgi:hypothetical protein
MDAYERWDYIPEQLLDPVLTEFHQAEFAGIWAKIMEGKKRISRSAGREVGDLLLLNEKGERPPIFWCFNNWAEPVLLARALGADQPVYAMHSFQSYTERWVQKGSYMEALAKTYVDNVLAITGGTSAVFGGNCQGAPIAESMAIQISNTHKIFPKLITLDYIPKRFYQGPLCMMFGRESPFNPFLSGGDPMADWQEKLTQFSWSTIEAGHGGYFREPAIQGLRKQIFLSLND